MPMHDWSRVDDGTFHAFHTGWILHLSETMNGGLLPPEYFALPEQWAGQTIADVLTFRALEQPPASRDEGGLAVLEFPPQVARKLTASASLRGVRARCSAARERPPYRCFRRNRFSLEQRPCGERLALG